MARRRETKTKQHAMPPELRRFRFADWTDPHDVEGFTPQKGEDIEEARFVHLAARAKRRQSEARERWKLEHGLIDTLPIGMRKRQS